MSPVQIIFLIIAAATLVSAYLVVTTRALVHAALWLVAALFGVGVMYALLNAGFFAVAQVLIYIGAIAILFIFAVMLTRRVMTDSGPQVNRNWWIAALVAFLLFMGLLGLLLQAPQVVGVTLPPLTNPDASLQDLGLALVDVDQYVLPFEVASILLLAALIGAMIIARPPSQEEVGK